MKMQIRFSPRYFVLFGLVFLIELFIGVYVRDTFIRPFVGDVLIIVLLYFFVLMFLDYGKAKVVIGVLLFAYMIELGQYYRLVDLLNLQDITVARIAIGSTFDVMDLLAYTLGALLLWSSIFIRRAVVENTANNPED